MGTGTRALKLPGAVRVLAGTPAHHVLGGAAFCAVSLLVLLSVTAQDAATARLLDNVHWTIGYAAGAALAWLGVLHGDAPDRRARACFAAGLTAYTIGQIAWDIQVAVGWNPFPGPSDAGFVLLGPFCVLGFVVAHQDATKRGLQRGLVLDIIVTSVAITTLALALYLPRRGGTPPLQLFVLTVYPVFLISAAAVGALVMLYVRPRLESSWVLLLTSLLVTGGLWMAWNAFTLDGLLADGTVYNGAFSWAAIGIGAGAARLRLVPSTDARYVARADAAVRHLPVVCVVLSAFAVQLSFALPGIPDQVRWLNVASGFVVALVSLLRQSMLVDELHGTQLRAETALSAAQSYATHLEREVAQRERIEHTLRATEAEQTRLIAELQSKNAEMEQFTYTVSHDLKSPVVTVSGYVGMIEQDLAEHRPDRVAADLQRIRAAADRMTELLDDLLELSRVGRVAATQSVIAAEPMVREVLAALSGVLEQREIAAEIILPLGTLRGDKTRISQVFQNLIENAAKYMGTQTEPRITIRARSIGHHLEFCVADNGVGLEERHFDKIFRLFEQLDPSAPGTGVGLALARRIVESHGGKIWVESQGPGRGAQFFFTLPAARPEEDDCGLHPKETGS
jgi:signal transduction histidine kinase